MYYWNTRARNTDNVKMAYIIGQCTVFAWCIYCYIMYSKSHVTFMFTGFMFQKSLSTLVTFLIPTFQSFYNVEKRRFDTNNFY